MLHKAKRSNGIHLVHPRREAEEPRNGAGAKHPPPDQQQLERYQGQRFESGDMVPRHGVYRVLHARHRLPHEVTLLRGNTFPPCSRCESEVKFELVRGVQPGAFRIALNELPELPEIGQGRSAKDVA